MKSVHGSTRRFSQVMLLVATLIVTVSLQGLALGQVLKPGKTPIMRGPKVIEEDKITTSGTGPPDRVSILIHMAPGADRSPMQGFIKGQGAFVKYRYNVVLPKVINVRNFPTSALNGLLSIPGVERWEEDLIVHKHLNDSTPLIRALQSQIAGAGLSATGSGVRVCVLDTGIDSDHAMYSGRIDIAAGRDFVNNDYDPEDDDGHGSHVAGIAVGGTGYTVDLGCVGSEPFQGVAPEAKLIGIKVLDADGSGSLSDVIAGINYGADQSPSGGRCDVMNLSLGAGSFTGTCDGDSAAGAANNAVDDGVVVIASSGNDHATNAMGTPACGSKVISVGATYDDDYPSCEFPDQASFTWQFCEQYFLGICISYGTCTDSSPSVDQIGCYSNRSAQLDVTAPGCITFSADFGNSPLGIVGFCGTSMAAPHVAGLAALLLHADPSLTPAQVRQYIRDGAIDLGAPGFDSVYGYGRIDVINSLSLVGPQCTTNDDCNDGDLCTVDSCEAGTCYYTPLDCDDDDVCTTDSCDAATGNCLHDPISCDDSDPCTVDSCKPAIGCEHTPLCAPEEICDNGVCVPQVCDNDDVCESGEDCNNCPNDCIGRQEGKPSKRFCCGNGICENGEDYTNCAVDCPAPECGNGICENGEDYTNCAVDCCGGKNASCSTNADCCSGLCKSNGRCSR